MPRDTDRSHLHPVFRHKLDELDALILSAGLPLQLYEGARSPFRQVELYARGRVAGSGTSTVTKARAWGSRHQHGLAADYVFRVGDQWSWEEPSRGAWVHYQRLAMQCGLEVLSFEKPHVQLPYVDGKLSIGTYPPGGDESWLHWIEDQIERWGRDARVFDGITHPGAPPLPSLFERPPLVT